MHSAKYEIEDYIAEFDGPIPEPRLTQDGPLHPEVEVTLVGQNGNIFNIMGRVSEAMRLAGVPKERVAEYQTAVMQSGSYDAALVVTMEWVTVL